MAQSQGTGRACIFCGSTKDITAEHVLPDWINRALGERLRVIYEWQTNGKPQKRFTERVRCVCHDCNTGWMSDLEQAAEPILSPMITRHDQVLSAADQMIVARWAFKTAVIWEQASPARTSPLIQPGQYRQLAKRSDLPPGLCVLIAGVRQTEPGPDRAIAGGRSLRPTPEFEHVPLPKMYRVSGAIGGFAFLITGAYPSQTPPTIPFTGDSAVMLTQIWPPEQA